MSILNNSNQIFKTNPLVTSNLLKKPKTQEELIQDELNKNQLGIGDLPMSDEARFAIGLNTNQENVQQQVQTSIANQKQDANAITKLANINEAAGVTTTKEAAQTKQGLSTTAIASIVSGATGLAQVGTSIYGAIQANKMQPNLMSYSAPIEAKLIESNNAAIQSASEESIDKSIAGARDIDRRNGMDTGSRNSIYLSKELEANNQIASQLNQMDNQIKAQNAQIENQTKQFNRQTAMQSDQFNAQTQNQFNQWKSSIVGAGLNNATNGIYSSANAILNNMNLQDTIERADVKNTEMAIRDDIQDLQRQYELAPDFTTKKQIEEKIAEKQKQLKI